MPGPADVGKAEDGQRAQMLRRRASARARRPAACRRAARRDTSAFRAPRPGGAASRCVPCKIGQRLGRVERPHLRHERREQVERAVGLGDEGRERAAPVARPARASGRSTSERPAASLLSAAAARSGSGDSGSRNARLRPSKRGAPLLVDQPRRGVGKARCRDSRAPRAARPRRTRPSPSRSA